ncbi:TPA: uridine kinase [Listeria monocytogenes]
MRICGNGAGGKSYLTSILIKSLQENGICTNYLCTDDYLLDAYIRKNINSEVTNRRITANNPKSYFYPALKRDISMLKKHFTLITIYQGKLLDCDYRSISFIDGLGTAFLEKELFDLSIFIYSDKDTELEMRLQRDFEVRNIEKSKIMDDFENRREEFEKIIQPLKTNFDVILRNEINQIILEKVPGKME